MEKSIKETTAFCKNHPTSKLGKDQFGNYYMKCWTGHKFNEPCKVIVEEKETIVSSKKRLF